MGARAGPLALLLGACLSAGEIVDRIAVTVDRSVITESAVVQHARVTAFLNGGPLEVNGESKRAAAGRLVEQALIQREIEISLYPMPSVTEVDDQLEKLKADNFPDPAAYLARLEKYGISEADLRENVRAQLLILHFIDYRFRPGITVSDAEVRQYYKEEFLPALAQSGPGATPSLEDSRERIEEILINRRINEALDSWLERAKRQATIRYREEAFE
ncbi:MAG: hypothetical protein KIT09_30730 [Bryobacteraceae bacterium]|nr:hypothetical protein [Bryobacteraceae bacterium]